MAVHGASVTGDEGTGPPDEAASTVDAFELVGNEIRADIVRTFGDARAEARARPVLSFSELRERVDHDVRSSRFNYHLQELVGHYVERVEDGYRLRPEGRALYTTLRAGTFTRRRDIDPVPVGLDCYHCGAPVEAAMEGGHVAVRCPDCDHLYDMLTAPPGAVDEEGIDPGALGAYNHRLHLQFAHGVCPFCGSPLDAEFLAPGEVPYDHARRHEAFVYRSCGRCAAQMFLTVGQVALTDPGVVAFCHEHGVDVLSTPFWELEFAATDRGVTVRSTDPWEVALRVEYGDDALELVFDEDLAVVERRRT